jgi:hypothetical protein
MPRNGGNADLRWYDSRGAEIGRGRTLDLRTLRPGHHALHAVALNTGQGGGSAVWALEHQRSGRFVLHLPQPQRQPQPQPNDTTTEE